MEDEYKYEYRTTKDYLSTGIRNSIHSSLRSDVYIDILTLLAKTRSPLSKAIDILILNMMSSEANIKEFENSMRNYRLKKVKD